MTVKAIRSIEELENLKVEITDKLDELRKTATSQDDLMFMKQLRSELNDVVDELAVAKNIEADQVKAKRLAEIRDTEKESVKYNKEYIKLLAEIVPALEMLAKLLPKANWLAIQLQGNRQKIENLRTNYQKEFGEEITVTAMGCRGLPNYDIQALLEWLSDDLNRALQKEKEVTIK